MKVLNAMVVNRLSDKTLIMGDNYRLILNEIVLLHIKSGNDVLAIVNKTAVVA